jgi:hypothetical protein
MSYMKHKTLYEKAQENERSTIMDDIFPAVELSDALERVVFVTTMDTSAGGTKTACGCCPKRGC